jgi:transposase
MMQINYPLKAMERAMKIQEIILRAMSKQITWIQAAEIIGISPRQMRRWKTRYEHYGYDGLFDRRRRTPSPRRVPLRTAETILQLYREKYFDFNMSHFHEKLKKVHKIDISYNWVRLALEESGLVAKHPRKSPHRLRRPRKPLVGMMLHIDGSPFDWLGTEEELDLIVICDDANNEIYDMMLVPEEDTRSCMECLHNTVKKKGIFCSLYSDRASHFFLTKKTGDHVVKNHRTQIGRALQELGIQAIPAYSPQARGRSERLNGTLQGRLPQEFRLRGIKTIDKANSYLRKTYIPLHNQRFIHKPEQAGSAFLPIPFTADLHKIFSLKHERTVNKDNTVSFNNRIFQINPSTLRVSFAKCKITIYEHLDGSLTLGFGPHTLGYYSPKGEVLNPRNSINKKLNREHSNFLLSA